MKNYFDFKIREENKMLKKLYEWLDEFLTRICDEIRKRG